MSWMRKVYIFSYFKSIYKALPLSKLPDMPKLLVMKRLFVSLTRKKQAFQYRNFQLLLRGALAVNSSKMPKIRFDDQSDSFSSFHSHNIQELGKTGKQFWC